MKAAPLSQSPLSQSPEYAAALRALGVDLCQIGPALAIRRRMPLLGRVTYLPRAPLPDDLPPGPILINAPDPGSDAAHRAAGHLPVMTPQTLALLDLRPEAPARLAAQHGKWRNRLRRAQKAPLRLTQDHFDPARHDWLLRQETAQRRARGYTALPHDFVRAYPSRQTLLIQALRDNSPVAAMLFLLHAPAATYHIGWSTPEGRRLNAHPLILWYASQTLRDRGLTQIDLGTLDTQNAPGLARFKLGSGAAPWSLGHTWLHLPRLSPLLRTFRRRRGFPSGLLS